MDEAVEPYLHAAALVDRETPVRRFHRVWVTTVLQEVLRQLREECCRKQQEVWFDIFDQWIVKPELEGVASVPLLALAKRHRVSAKTAANSIITIKRKFIRLLKAEIGTYALTKGDVELEARDVLRLLSMETPR